MVVIKYSNLDSRFVNLDQDTLCDTLCATLNLLIRHSNGSYVEWGSTNTSLFNRFLTHKTLHGMLQHFIQLHLQNAQVI